MVVLGAWISSVLIDIPTSQGADLLNIADKLTTIGILIYISLSLNKKLEKMQEAFQAEEKEIRANFREDLKNTNELFTKNIGLISEKHEQNLKYILETLKQTQSVK